MQEVNRLRLTSHLVEQLRNGATYLRAAYNDEDGSIVSHVYDGASLTETGGAWRRPEAIPVEERKIEIVNATSATDIYALSAPLACAAS